MTYDVRTKLQVACNGPLIVSHYGIQPLVTLEHLVVSSHVYYSASQTVKRWRDGRLAWKYLKSNKLKSARERGGVLTVCTYCASFLCITSISYCAESCNNRNMYAWKYWHMQCAGSSVQTDELRPRWVSLSGSLKRLKAGRVDESENQDQYRMALPLVDSCCSSH